MGLLNEICNKGRKSAKVLRLYHHFTNLRIFFGTSMFSAKYVIRRNYKRAFGRYPNLDNPVLLTEKLQWLKLYEHDDFHTICADKFKVREYLGKTFGEEYLIPLVYESPNYRDISPEIIPDYPCIIKPNHDSGHYRIIRDKSKVNFDILREEFRNWLGIDFYRFSKEWQYKNIKPRRFVIEKLLETSEGKIPNDFKLHYINGELQFIYVSYDREGINDRCTYDAQWNRLPFVWVPKTSYTSKMNTADVPRPKSLDKMIEIGNEVAKHFKYVRVDFYDVDGKLYFGEITLHHGSGFDSFIPESYDEYFGKKLKL